MASRTTTSAIPNQVFIGCPWKTVKAKYELAIAWLNKRYPLSFVIVGRDDGQDAEDLLGVIKSRLATSSYAIFDATGGNANVSLEFGYAEAKGIKRILYFSSHKAAIKHARTGSIISDLAGKKHNRYSQQKSLQQLLGRFASDHPYTLRFEKCMKQSFRKSSKGAKKRNRALALKVVHFLDGKTRVSREDLLNGLWGSPTSYKEDEIVQMVKNLHTAGLLRSTQGQNSIIEII